MEEPFSRLKDELKNAVSTHYERLTATSPDIYGYGIYTTDDVSGLGPVANRESNLTLDPSDKMYNYYRFLAVEWSDFDDFGLFDGVNKIISKLHDDESIEFSVKRERILRACLEALCEMEAKGIFGPRTDSRFVVICVADSDDDIMMESAKLLNTPRAFESYASEF